MVTTDFQATVYSEELYRIAPRTTVVLTVPWAEVTADEKEQLLKIMQALKQRVNSKLGSDAFSFVYSPILDLSNWVEKPSRLIYFGPPVKGLNPYEVIEAGQTKMVLSESLADLIPNEGSRTRLWSALRQLFAP